MAAHKDLRSLASHRLDCKMLKIGNSIFWRFSSVIAFGWLTACSSASLESSKVTIDMRPVGCDYKWFQTGTSPALRRSCALPRSEEIKIQQHDLALEHAWKIANQRCPAVCPPRELNDPSDWDEPFPNGTCRDGRVYYTARVFFRCGGSR